MNLQSSPNLITKLIAAVALFALATLAQPNPADAVTPNYSTAIPGVVVVPVHLSGQYTADVTAVAKIKLPFRAQIVGVSATARASGGTTPTLTVDVQDDGVTVLTAPVAITAGAVAEAALATATIADESIVTIDLAITGTTPTWDDIDVLLTLIRN